MWDLDYKESWAPKNWCFWTVVLEKTLESPLACKEIQPLHPKGKHWKDWCWSWSSNTLATWCEELTHWKRPLCWEILKVRREGYNRWDCWMASLAQWRWAWLSPGSLVMDREAWCAAVREVEKSFTWLNDWTELNWIQFRRALHWWPNHLPKTPSPNTITLKGQMAT